jgi:hypothetical protein
VKIKEDMTGETGTKKTNKIIRKAGIVVTKTRELFGFGLFGYKFSINKKEVLR